MTYTFEYKYPGESDEMWNESSQRGTLDFIAAQMMEWTVANAINGCIVEVRLVELPNAN